MTVQEQDKAVPGFLPGLRLEANGEVYKIGNCEIRNVYENGLGIAIVRKTTEGDKEYEDAVADIKRLSQAISLYYQIHGELRVSSVTVPSHECLSADGFVGRCCRRTEDIPRTPRDSDIFVDAGFTGIQCAYEALGVSPGNQDKARSADELMALLRLSDRAGTWLERMVFLWQAIECLVSEYQNERSDHGMRASLESLPKDLALKDEAIKPWLSRLVGQNRLKCMASKGLTLGRPEHRLCDVSQKLQNQLNGDHSAQDYYSDLLRCALLAIYAWRNNVFHRGADLAKDDEQQLTQDCVIVMDSFVRAAIQSLIGAEVCGAKYTTGSLVSLRGACCARSSASCQAD